MIVDQANGDDADALQRLLYQLTGDVLVNVNAERLEQIRDCDDSVVFVARENNTVIGTVQLTLCPDIMYGFQPYAILENIVVCKELRLSGVGGALMSKAQDYCIERQCSKMMLLSTVKRTEAHRFFEKCGFLGSEKRGFVKYRSSCLAEC